MTKPIIMLIDDNPISEVKIALAKEHHDRTDVFSNLCRAGHVKVSADNNPAMISCENEGEIFTEERNHFPSTVLMARLQLAVAAGRSCTNTPSDTEHASVIQHQLDAYRYAICAQNMGKKYGIGKSPLLSAGYRTRVDTAWIDDELADAVACGYSNISKITEKITATVKPPKGIRP